MRINTAGAQTKLSFSLKLYQIDVNKRVGLETCYSLLQCQSSLRNCSITKLPLRLYPCDASLRLATGANSHLIASIVMSESVNTRVVQKEGRMFLEDGKGDKARLPCFKRV